MSASPPSTFDASASALGYLYQCRVALHRALNESPTSPAAISIEKLDDVAVESDGTPLERIQTKHRVTRQGALSDKSVDLWKTLRTWCPAFTGSGSESVLLTLLTTASAPAGSAASLLRPPPSPRDPARALDLLLLAARDSTSSENAHAYKEFLALPGMGRLRLLESVQVCDLAPDILNVRALIEKILAVSVRPQHLGPLVDRLEGWWFARIVEHLSGSGQTRLPVVQVFEAALEFQRQFRDDNLPADFISTAPTEAALNTDAVFVKQLQLIRVSPERQQIARTDHFRAFAQRSQWVRDSLVGLSDLEGYETRLVDEWSHRFALALEACPEGTPVPAAERTGAELYNWIEDRAGSSAAMQIRPSFAYPYLARGSYHMLADRLRVGWHPRFREFVKPPGESP